ncbi:MAG TPA: anhydro-N-acetylmuramic acid kinase [Flavipsychrobacter sp.]|nr:anhydro-N-acetylmuramic acid kinase [Flavipsychrobacter sp.]
MIYKVIGLMSGSSLDGLDIAFVQLEEVRGQWTYQVLAADCVPYTEEWTHNLKHAQQMAVPDFLRLNTAYGRCMGEAVNKFITEKNIDLQVQFIASHGHTVLHEPANYTTSQIGDGAAIAAVTGLPVISDLRALDVALGGQGAPIVPIGDKLLFGQYDYHLNIGGIANITVQQDGKPLAFDVCPANQVLNTLAQKAGKPFDENGSMAASGTLLTDVLIHLNKDEYYTRQAPKSLSNEVAINMAFPALLESQHNTNDLLHTMVLHITEQVANAVNKYPTGKEQAFMLVTGGGAFNSFLIEKMQHALAQYNVGVIVPDADTVMYKEAVVMALIGALRWREETNVLSSVTGATRDSISGALWMGHSY